MPELNGLSRSLVTLDQDSTLIAVIDMSQSTWLVAGVVPGVERHPLKKLPSDETALLQLLQRWRNEAATARQPEPIAAGLESYDDALRMPVLSGSKRHPGKQAMR